jgi:hypothetical protein
MFDSAFLFFGFYGPVFLYWTIFKVVEFDHVKW